MVGYLEKKSPKKVLGRSAWQRRYFELVLLSSSERGNEILLYYFKSDSDADHKEPLGEIILNEILAVQDLSKEKSGRFDIQVPSRTYALKCDNPAELNKWCKALQSLSQMNDYQKPSHLPDSPAETMKLMSQNSLNNPTKTNQTTYKDATETIEMMTKGSAFIKYDYEKVSEKTTREIVLVFYQPDTTPLGSLYFCEPGEKVIEAQTALALHTLTDMYLGKQSKALKSNIASHAASDRCFTACGANVNGIPLVFNLEGDSKEQVAAWLFGINAILTHKGGRKVMTAEDSAKDEARKKELALAKEKEEAEAKARRAAAAEAERQAQLEKAKQAEAAATAAAAPVAVKSGIVEDETVVSFVGFEEDDDDDEEAKPAAATTAASSSTPATTTAAEPVAEPTPVVEQPASVAAAEPTPVVEAAAPVVEPVAEVAVPAESKSEEVPASVERSLSTSLAATTLVDGEETVATWLASLGDAYASEYAKLFRDNGVDLHFLVGLNGDDLTEMGIKNGLHLKKMLIGIEKLKETGKYTAPVIPTRQPSISQAPAPTPAPVAPVVVPEPESAPIVAVATSSAPAVDPSTLNEVGQFLYKLGPAFLVYNPTFADNGVDLNFLLTLQDDDLEELGVTKLHRKKLLQQMKEMREIRDKTKRASIIAPASSASAVVGGYLARAQAAKAANAASSPTGGTGSNNMDIILANIREAKAKRPGPGHGSQPSTDGIDLAGTSIAAIAARMAAQREARARAITAESAGAASTTTAPTEPAPTQ